MQTFQCDYCADERTGERVTVTTEATEGDGVDVAVTKRWTLCRGCGDRIFEGIGEVSPWVDDDFKTVLQPGDATEQHTGTFAMPNR